MNESRSARCAAAALLAAAFGFAGAAGELLYVGFERFVLGRHVSAGWHFSWMTPASWVTALLPWGIAVALAEPRLPQFGRERLRIFVPALAASIGFLFLLPLHKIAIVVLAAGLAAAVTRWHLHRPDAMVRYARRFVAGAAVATLAAAAAVHGGRAFSESRALASLPAARPGAPNVLLLVLDTVRASSLGLYGHGRPTSPAIDALGRRGVVFDRAHSTSSWTLPSHASFFTGRYPHELSASWDTPLDREHPTLAEVLAAQGYDTAGFVANVDYCSRETGLDRGFGRYEAYRLSLGTFVVASSPGRIVAHNPTLQNLVGWFDLPGRKTAREIDDAFLSWLGEGRDRPWFAFLNYYDAHEPYLSPEPWESKFGPNPPRGRLMLRERFDRIDDPGTVPEEERRKEEQAYDSCIAWLDDEIGRLLSELERRGTLDDTIVVLTSDHGELFGEHELFFHGNCLYLPLLHVPLVVAHGPVTRAGTRVETPVSLRDLPATILELAGAPPGLLPGTSLAPFVRGDGSALPTPSPIAAEVLPVRNQPPNLPLARGPMHSLVEDRHHLIRNGDDVPELYDVVADPDELRDLARQAAAARNLAILRAALEAVVGPLHRAPAGGSGGPR